MSAFNWILFASRCPVCEREVELRCQAHVAADYGGDGTGRFHDREYHLGEKMAWWMENDPRYLDWRYGGKLGELQNEEVDWECCSTECPSCAAELYAVIQFDGPRAAMVLDVGLGSNWPSEYLK
jgi:hypothetical protein